MNAPEDLGIMQFTNGELESMLYSRIVSVGGGVSPVALARYVNSLGGRGARLLSSMKHPQLSFNVLRVETSDDGSFRDLVLSEEGYDYVCARIKADETVPSERADLRKAKSLYELVVEFDRLSDAIMGRDFAKAGRILSKGARA